MTWTNTRLKHLCLDAGQYGLNISADQYTPSGVRLIRTSDIAEDGSLKSFEQGVFVDVVLEPRHQLHRGDILLSRSGTLGRSFLAPEKAEGQTFAGFLIRFRPQAGVDPRFIHYAAQSKHFQGIVHSEAVSSTIQNFNAERYANIPLLVPGAADQRRIADFLDAETARIDQLHRRDQKLTGLLIERRQAVIDHEVDHSSDVFIKLFWNLSLLRDGTHQPPPRVNSGVPLLTARNVSKGNLQLTELDTYISEADATVLEESLSLSAGDVLLSVKGTIGACAVTPPGFPRAVLDRNVALLRPRSGQSSDWLAFVLRSTRLQEQMRISVSAAAQPGLPLGIIRDLRVPDVPAKEQGTRASRVAMLCQEIDEVLSRVRRKEEILTERRQALITAAVTGQFDVTAASGRGVTEGVAP